MVKSEVQTAVVARDESQPVEATQPQRNADNRPGDTSAHDPEQRVNIAEEFYLEVTERPDVREVLRRLANL
jgi:hypothetical protein